MIDGTTCWTMIQGAAAGDAEARDAFALRYAPVIRAYLESRWRHAAAGQEIEDVVQEVLLESFRRGGVLDRLEHSKPRRFRAFLYGVTRHVALAAEERRRRRPAQALPESSDRRMPEAPGDRPSVVFHKAWARTLLQQAAELQAARARESGERSLKRLELLRLRFESGLPIREIAARWHVEADLLHREYARARKEFRAALAEVLDWHCPNDARARDREWRHLQGLLD